MQDMVVTLGQTSTLMLVKINNLFIPSARTTNYRLKQLKVNGPRIWNALPNNIKNMKSLRTFWDKLKVHYISEYG